MCKKNVKNFSKVKINKNMEERERIVRGIKNLKNFLTSFWIITIFLGALVNSGKSLKENLNFKTLFLYFGLIKTTKTSPSQFIVH